VHHQSWIDTRRRGNRPDCGPLETGLSELQPQKKAAGRKGGKKSS
jgi:hypothetical protein